ncbi:hypothetical protein, partial [Desulfobacter latus]
MTNSDDNVLVHGNFVMDSSSGHGSLLTSGTLELKGDFTQKSTYSSWPRTPYENENFRASGTHRVLLSGTDKQTVSFSTPSCNRSHFNILEITNTSSDGVTLASRVIVTGEMAQTTTPIVNSNNLSLSGNALISQGNWKYDLILDSLCSDWTLQQDQVVDKNFYLKDGTLDLNGKTLTVTGDLIYSGDTLTLNGGTLVVKGDLIHA